MGRLERGSGIKGDMHTFWIGLIELSDSKTELFHSVNKVSKNHCIMTSVLNGRFKFGYIVKQHDSWVELNITAKDGLAQPNHEFLMSRRREIESAFGEPIEWRPADKNPGKTRVVLSRSKLGGFKDGSQLPLMKDLVDRMVRMEVAFIPHLNAMR